ncbi:MAG TPA: FAD binding domain-containing protein [Actinocrinis sp.]|jgi:CO/xanthine dehydrogenase FAD-binding subunit
MTTALDPESASALDDVSAMRPPAPILFPQDIDEALQLLAADGAVALGGGVGHLLRRRESDRCDVSAYVSVRGLPELRAITWSDREIRIGAGVRLSEIEADPRLAAAWPALTAAAGSVATGRIRRMVTLGGNVCARDDSHDPPVALAALGAELTVRSAGATRTLRLDQLSELSPDELVQDFRLPRPQGLCGSAFEKFLVRGVWEYACVHVAAVVGLNGSGATERLSLAVGSVQGGPVSIDLSDLIGIPADQGLSDTAARRAAAATRPYDDVRGSAAYKTLMIAEFTRRALAGAIRRAEPAEGDGPG